MGLPTFSQNQNRVAINTSAQLALSLLWYNCVYICQKYAKRYLVLIWHKVCRYQIHDRAMFIVIVCLVTLYLLLTRWLWRRRLSVAGKRVLVTGCDTGRISRVLANAFYFIGLCLFDNGSTALCWVCNNLHIRLILVLAKWERLCRLRASCGHVPGLAGSCGVRRLSAQHRWRSKQVTSDVLQSPHCPPNGHHIWPASRCLSRLGHAVATG